MASTSTSTARMTSSWASRPRPRQQRLTAPEPAFGAAPAAKGLQPISPSRLPSTSSCLEQPRLKLPHSSAASIDRICAAKLTPALFKRYQLSGTPLLIEGCLRSPSSGQHDWSLGSFVAAVGPEQLTCRIHGGDGFATSPDRWHSRSHMRSSVRTEVLRESAKRKTPKLHAICCAAFVEGCHGLHIGSSHSRAACTYPPHCRWSPAHPCSPNRLPQASRPRMTAMCSTTSLAHWQANGSRQPSTPSVEPAACASTHCTALSSICESPGGADAQGGGKLPWPPHRAAHGCMRAFVRARGLAGGESRNRACLAPSPPPLPSRSALRCSCVVLASPLAR